MFCDFFSWKCVCFLTGLGSWGPKKLEQGLNAKVGDIRHKKTALFPVKSLIIRVFLSDVWVWALPVRVKWDLNGSMVVVVDMD